MKLVPSCLEASKLLSRALDEPLGLLDRTLLRLHLSMCGRCAEVQQQLALLHDLAAASFDGTDEPPDRLPRPGAEPPQTDRGDPA